MNLVTRGLAALGLSALLASGAAFALQAQDAGPLSSERARISYVIGMDVGESMVAAAPDMDFASFERAVAQAMAGGAPLLEEQEAASVGQALMQRMAARSGRRVPGLAPGAQPPSVDPGKVGLLTGLNVGRSLAPLAETIDLPVFMQAVRTVAQGGKPLLDTDQIVTREELERAGVAVRHDRPGVGKGFSDHPDILLNFATRGRFDPAAGHAHGAPSGRLSRTIPRAGGSTCAWRSRSPRPR